MLCVNQYNRPHADEREYLQVSAKAPKSLTALVVFKSFDAKLDG
jgi:hypothetical protein